MVVMASRQATLIDDVMRMAEDNIKSQISSQPSS
jgi:hypothetical protein